MSRGSGQGARGVVFRHNYSVDISRGERDEKEQLMSFTFWVKTVTKSSALTEEGRGGGGVRREGKMENSFQWLEAEEYQIWLLTQQKRSQRGGEGRERDHQDSLISSISSQLPAIVYAKVYAIIRLVF